MLLATAVVLPPGPVTRAELPALDWVVRVVTPVALLVVRWVLAH